MVPMSAHLLLDTHLVLRVGHFLLVRMYTRDVTSLSLSSLGQTPLEKVHASRR